MTAVFAGLTRHPGSLLKELDLTKVGFLALLDRAATLKLDRVLGCEARQLAGKHFALMDEATSTADRWAFEVAAHDEGAHVTYLDCGGSRLGGEEAIGDTARVLGRLFDGIGFRGCEQGALDQLALCSGVPVWNVGTDSWHPTQMLADVLTMIEHHAGSLESIRICVAGDGRNSVARSMLVTGALLGFDVRIAAPGSLQPPADVLHAARGLAAVSGARLVVTDDLHVAVSDVDYLYTDLWVSVGESESEWERRVPMLLPYRVTAEVMAATGNPATKFLHCLPSIHDASTALGRRVLERYGVLGAEVADEVFGSPASVVFEQAENRLHALKAVLVDAWQV